MIKLPLAMARMAKILQISTTGKICTSCPYNIILAGLNVKIGIGKSICGGVVLSRHRCTDQTWELWWSTRRPRGSGHRYQCLDPNRPAEARLDFGVHERLEVGRIHQRLAGSDVVEFTGF